MKSDPNNDDNYCNLGVTNDIMEKVIEVITAQRGNLGILT